MIKAVVGPFVVAVTFAVTVFVSASLVVLLLLETTHTELTVETKQRFLSKRYSFAVRNTEPTSKENPQSLENERSVRTHKVNLLFNIPVQKASLQVISSRI